MKLFCLDSPRRRKLAKFSCFLFILLLPAKLAWANLPPGWTDLDIGSPAQTGYATYTNGGWTVGGGGNDIWNNTDQFNLASESVSGDGEMVAQVLTIQSADAWSKAGVMFRDDTTAGSANVAVVATIGNGVSFQWRSTANGISIFQNVAGLTAPVWVKLARAGTNFSAFYSNDGNSWTQVGATQGILLNTNFLAGLAVTAHNNAAFNVSAFTNVTVAVQPPVISPPVVANSPVANVQPTMATLVGQVLSTGNQTPSVMIFYGPSDGGTNAASWSNSVVLGSQAAGFGYTVTGLATNTTYYYTAFASNSAGSAWAYPSQSFATPASAPSVQPIFTYRYDNSRQGANTNELQLTPLNVNVNNFGKLFSYNVDGYVFAQPLVATNVTIPGRGAHNVLYVVSENDSVYAFDADAYISTPYWIASLLTSGGTAVPGGDAQGNISPFVGVTATPVIDPATGTIYVEAFTKETSGASVAYVHRLHALDMTTGLERTNFNSPAVISCTNYPGTGTPGQNDVDGQGHILWNGLRETCRSALLLANGTIYICYASPGDHPPYYGWVFAYNAQTLAQTGVFNDTPNAGYGGIWMTGNGPAADTNGAIYLNTGNGAYDTNSDYGDSFLKLTNGLGLLDYFTPYNQATLFAQDLDVSSAGLSLLPDSAGSSAHPHLLLGGSKTGSIYLLDRDNLGRYNPSGDTQIVQSLVGAVGGMWCSAAYFNGLFYVIGSGDRLKSFTMTNATMGTTPTATSPNAFGSSTPCLSANGTENGVLWAIDTSGSGSSGASVLYAYNATNVSQMLYSSSQNFARDNPGGAVEFITPVVANGKVYMGAQYAVSIFGNGMFLATPVISPQGGVFTNSVTVTLSDPTPGTSIYYTLDGTTPTTNSILYTGPFVLTQGAVLQAVAAAPGFVTSGPAEASFINSSAIGNGTGLFGAYYGNHSSTNPYSGSPTMMQTDAVVDFTWTAGPGGGIAETNFTVRWTGCVQPQYNETYTFYATADDGVRLWVNGQQLINGWVDQAPTTYQGSIALQAQQLYNIEMDYYQDGGGATARLQWSSPSTIEAVIPTSQLYPYTNPPPSIVIASPTNNATYTASASVTIAANADAPYNPITQVSFYANSNLVGTVTNVPYTVTATGLGAGAYVLTAVAVDGSGLSSTSAPVNIAVNTGSGAPYGMTTNPPVNAFLNMPTTFNGVLPSLLSQTGAYSDTLDRVPSSGLMPYVPNVPLWSDGAVKSRYMALPSDRGAITPNEQIAFLPTNSWTFPVGTVFVKNFDLVVNQTNASVPARRLETRLLVRDINGGVYGVTYKWRPDNSDADLLTTSSNEVILVTNATGVTAQTWYYPSPADCLICHTPIANYVLGVNTRQLNNTLTYPATGNADNQLRTLNRLGLFNPAFDEATISNFEAMSALTNLSASFQQRARSYLDANCAQCHQPGGTGITFDARYDTPLALQNITNYPATFSLGYDNASIVKGDDVWRSMIWQRMNSTNSTIKMPPLARNLVDTNAVAVMAGWINSLPGVPALAPPIITPNGGSYIASVGVTLTPPNNNAAIYYTLDRSLPTTNSLLYSGTFNLTSNATISASAFETNFNNSVAASALFIVPPMQFVSENFSNGVFQLQFLGSIGRNYVLQVSTNLTTWTPLATNPATTNGILFLDANARNYPARFYRVLQQ